MSERVSEWMEPLGFLYKITNLNAGRPHSLCFGLTIKRPGGHHQRVEVKAVYLGNLRMTVSDWSLWEKAMELVKQGSGSPFRHCSHVLPLFGNLSVLGLRCYDEINLRRYHSGEIAVLPEDLKSLPEMSTQLVSAPCPIRTKWQKQWCSKEGVASWSLACRELASPASRPLRWGLGVFSSLVFRTIRYSCTSLPTKWMCGLCILKARQL